MNFFLRAKITLSSGEYSNLRKQTEVNHDIWINSEQTIFKLPSTSVSKRGFVLNHSYGNVFRLYVHFYAKQTHFHKWYEWFCTNTRFETGAHGNSFSCVCPVIDHEFRHNIVKVAVTIKFIVNNRTDALETDINLFFTITNCQIVRSRSLTHRINDTFMCLSTIDNRN